MKKGAWIPLLGKFRVECCDCGLTHDIEVRVYKNVPQWRATPIKKQHMLGETKVEEQQEQLTAMQKVKIRALKRAGWKQTGIAVWRSPSGLTYRGLEACYKMMKSHPELNDLSLTKGIDRTAR